MDEPHMRPMLLCMERRDEFKMPELYQITKRRAVYSVRMEDYD